MSQVINRIKRAYPKKEEGAVVYEDTHTVPSRKTTYSSPRGRSSRNKILGSNQVMPEVGCRPDAQEVFTYED